LFEGYQHRSLQLVADQSAAFSLEVDETGNGEWKEKSIHRLEKAGNLWVEFPADQLGVWVRLKAKQGGAKISALFHYRNDDARDTKAAVMFEGIAQPGDIDLTGGVLHARGGGFKTLRFISAGVDGKKSVYDLGDAFNLKSVEDAAGLAWTSKNAAIPEGVLTQDAASILVVDDKGRWRLPRGDAALDEVGPLGAERVCREVCTERDLLNAGGTFFELPAENAGGFAKLRPVTTHNRRIKDYASYRGLMVMSGLRRDAEGEHIVRSSDGQTALWVGAVDDLWKFGKVRGTGGPWQDSAVKAGVPSDPYLFTGYDRKRLTLSADKAVGITVEADVTGTGLWVTYQRFEVKPGEALSHTFPPSFGAYWLRVIADQDATATAQLVYD
jgi:hypothetical protein